MARKSGATEKDRTRRRRKRVGQKKRSREALRGDNNDKQ